ncbi:MAG: hypothetical protein IKL28_03705 [Lachnospiraceae bacterium]|nr:hypothetical protein [Lachnospiraceae bacterium]
MKKNEFTMSVSPICSKDGKKFAYVSFTDGERSAEGKIPECKIVSATGFDRGEIRMLEEYMTRELPRLKSMAAGIRLVDAFLK